MPFVPDTPIQNPGLYSPLALAFVGDGVYELYVRTRLLAAKNLPAALLHKRAIGYVKAAAQAISFHAMQEKLSKSEMAIYKRGRNAKSHTVPKNADMTEYRIATGLEALLGYLYLAGEKERLEELMSLAFDANES